MNKNTKEKFNLTVRRERALKTYSKMSYNQSQGKNRAGKPRGGKY